MSLIYTQIRDALAAGATVVVPSRQRAQALQLALGKERLAAGVTTWESADVRSWGGWLAQLADAARGEGLAGLRRLTPLEDWLVWRRAAAGACADYPLLDPGRLVDALRRSWQRQLAWGIEPARGADPEQAMLREVLAGVQESWRSQGAYSLEDWPRLLAAAPAEATRDVVLAGFDAPGRALEAALRSRGARFLGPMAAGDGAGEGGADARATPTVVAARDSADEAMRCAHWCRGLLRDDPSARILVVVPRLAELRFDFERSLAHALHGNELVAMPGDPAYAFEGGRPLSAAPLVDAALLALRLAQGPLEFAALSRLLRSPYLDFGGLAARAQVELDLRDAGATEAGLDGLLRLAQRRGPSCAALAASITSLGQPGPAPGGASAAAGAMAGLAGQLALYGWPGSAAPDSVEEQQQSRLVELMGEIATAGAGDAGSARGSLELLAELAGRVRFEPASDDPAVTVTDSLDDPLAPYAGVWVAGLTEDRWPPPATPDPFLDARAQRAAGIPEASVEGQLARASRAHAAWAAAAGQLVLSWPAQDADLALQPGDPLGEPRLPAHDRAPIVAVPDPLLPAGATGHFFERCLEPWPEPPPRPWPGTGAMPGGTRLLELQSLCPFRASATLRLKATPIEEPAGGFSAAEQGLMLHAALEGLWRDLHDSAGLLAASAEPARLDGIVEAQCAAAVARAQAQRVAPVPVPVAENECGRLRSRLHAMLAADRRRAADQAYAVQVTEGEASLALAGGHMRVRVDRIDRLDDGSLIVIDYKSGKALTLDLEGARPARPQLAAYALLAGEAVAAVAAAHLEPARVAWRGLESRPRLLPSSRPQHLRPHLPWPDLQRQWRTVLEGLAAGFLRGEAAVDPQSDACRNCGLESLCRVDAARRRTEVADAGGAESPASGEDGLDDTADTVDAGAGAP